jgi:hypothetical protein
MWVGLTWYNIGIARDLFGLTVAIIIPTLGFFFCCYMRGREDRG